VECTAEGEIIIIPPTYSRTGKRKSRITAQLVIWADKDGRGDVYDPSSGFRLPNSARRSPDASWIRKDRVAALPKEQQEGFCHLCPDLVIELGWLIDPEERTVWIYRPGCAAECIVNPVRIAGEGPVAGFVLELAAIWA
jgi:Uma2 family endonuclease